MEEIGPGIRDKYTGPTTLAKTIIKMKLILFFLFLVHFCLLGPDVTQANPYLVEFRIHCTVQSAVHCPMPICSGGGG
jgi:hypothetical protein